MIFIVYSLIPAITAFVDCLGISEWGKKHKEQEAGHLMTAFY